MLYSDLAQYDQTYRTRLKGRCEALYQCRGIGAEWLGTVLNLGHEIAMCDALRVRTRDMEMY